MGGLGAFVLAGRETVASRQRQLLLQQRGRRTVSDVDRQAASAVRWGDRVLDFAFAR